MVRKHLTYANVAATLALLLVISGVAYAASLPRNSVGTRALKDQAVTTRKLHDAAVGTKKTKNFGLRLRDLGGESQNNLTQDVLTDITLAPGECRGQLTGNFGESILGSMVIGTITDANGDAVLPNAAAVMPTMVSKHHKEAPFPS
ncbi:MAG: hypothetical protein ACRDJT_06565 [Actinomycetota bacterium]